MLSPATAGAFRLLAGGSEIPLNLPDQTPFTGLLLTASGLQEHGTILSYAHASVTPSLQPEDFIYIDGGNGSPVLPFEMALSAPENLQADRTPGDVMFSDGSVYYFGFGQDDFLTGTEAAEHFYGGGGDDTLDGGRGIDSIFGGEGADRLSGDGLQNRIFGGNGDDTIVATDKGSNPESPFQQIHILHGDDGNDVVDASGTIRSHPHGGPGDDLIIASQSGIHRGGHGDDTLHFANDGFVLDLEQGLFTGLTGAPEGHAAGRIFCVRALQRQLRGRPGRH